jgi:hypothetical protein
MLTRDTRQMLAGLSETGRIMAELKRLAEDPEDGYLHVPLFERMRDGRNDDAVKKWFLGPFAENRPWLPEMQGIFIARFFDHPYAHVVARNMAEEFGIELNAGEPKPSHSALYRRLLDECGVSVLDGMTSIPIVQRSTGSRIFYDWFRERLETQSAAYLLALLWAYEIEGDKIDFPFFLTAAKRIWPGRTDLLQFFVEHAETTHDIVFGADLQPMFDEHGKEMVGAMCDLHERYVQFYRATSDEVVA